MEEKSFLNSYDNTEELLQQFPVEHPTPVTTEMEKRIQNRLLTGFANWNRGFDAWKAWGDILYTPESLYNVHSVHLTLKEYQTAMYGTLRRADIQMGAFHHMLVSDSWCAIRYAITTTPRGGGEAVHDTVMEFVHFGDFGKDLGTRVIEGWAGTRGKDYDMLTMLQTKEEKEAQARAQREILSWKNPDTEDLEKKYPVLHPTKVVGAQGEAMRQLILSSFDAWNTGSASWGDALSENLAAHFDDRDEDKASYLAGRKREEETVSTKRLYFDSMLLAGDMAAIHYRTARTDLATGEKTPGERMQFLRFADENGTLKIQEIWTK